MLKKVKRNAVQVSVERVDGAVVEVRVFRCKFMGIVKEWWLDGKQMRSQIVGPVDMSQVSLHLRRKEERGLTPAAAMIAAARGTSKAPAALTRRFLAILSHVHLVGFR